MTPKIVPPVTLATAWVNCSNGGVLRTGRLGEAPLAVVTLVADLLMTDLLTADLGGVLGDTPDDGDAPVLLNTLMDPNS
ncbi:MAG: hypothetical protein NZ772_15625 [Cyanobacteria bacterium]|nr:hypothetical protein [Cyanobacteriota bacterium]MDW8202762.1 hypothetical protein [Cyanobacteriota bacterium SKYGB_h_bin112]